MFSLNFIFKNGLRFNFDSVSGVNYSFLTFFHCRESQAKTQAIFQAKTRAEYFSIESGPRVFCYSSDRDSDCVVVFDVWNPDSVDVESDNVGVIERMLDVRRCCGLGSVPTPCVICSSSKGRLYICDECLYDEELGLQQ